MASFQGTTEQQLHEWLDQNGVDTTGYGKGKAKTVVELLEETTKRESTLTIVEGQAQRTVQVLSLHIRNSKGQILFEEEQILPDGRSRVRTGVALSEKLVGDESWRDAVDRAVHEELGSILPEKYEITVFEDTYQLLGHVSNSNSYPNIRTKYTFHRVSAEVTGLPEGRFTTFEERPGGRLVTHWMWRFKHEVPGSDGTDVCASS